MECPYMAVQGWTFHQKLLPFYWLPRGVLCSWPPQSPRMEKPLQVPRGFQPRSPGSAGDIWRRSPVGPLAWKFFHLHGMWCVSLVCVVSCGLCWPSYSRFPLLHNIRIHVPSPLAFNSGRLTSHSHLLAKLVLDHDPEGVPLSLSLQKRHRTFTNVVPWFINPPPPPPSTTKASKIMYMKINQLIIK